MKRLWVILGFIVLVAGVCCAQSIDPKENRKKYCEGNSKYLIKCLMDKKINDVMSNLAIDISKYKNETELKEQLKLISNDLQSIMLTTYLSVGSHEANQKTVVDCEFYSKKEKEYKVEITFSDYMIVSIIKKNKSELIKEDNDNKKALNNIPPQPK